MTIVTTSGLDGNDIGLTANSFNSVSLTPPLVLWSLKKDSLSFDAFVAADFFAVHVLAQDQEIYSSRFASRGVDKFADLNLARGPGNIPLLNDCAARFVCKTAFRYAGGDHEIFVGEVVEFDHSDLPPLLFHNGKYAKLLQVELETNTDITTEEEMSGLDQGFLITLLGRAHTQMQSKIRTELSCRRLAINQYYLISLLGSFDNRTLDQLRDVLARAEMEVNDEMVEDLINKNLISYDPTSEHLTRLTTAGQKLLMELASLSKDIENHALEELDFDQQQSLKLMLLEIITTTDPGPPASWPSKLNQLTNNTRCGG